MVRLLWLAVRAPVFRARIHATHRRLLAAAGALVGIDVRDLAPFMGELFGELKFAAGTRGAESVLRTLQGGLVRCEGWAVDCLALAATYAADEVRRNSLAPATRRVDLGALAAWFLLLVEWRDVDPKPGAADLDALSELVARLRSNDDKVRRACVRIATRVKTERTIKP